MDDRISHYRETRVRGVVDLVDEILDRAWENADDAGQISRDQIAEAAMLVRSYLIDPESQVAKAIEEAQNND